MVFSAVYALIVGTLMIGQWIFFISTGRVPEFQSEPVRIAFHLAAEGVTACALIAAGIFLLLHRPGASRLGFLAYGLGVYTLIVSPGYFAQTNQWPFVAMFGVLLVLAAASIALLLRSEKERV